MRAAHTPAGVRGAEMLGPPVRSGVRALSASSFSGACASNRFHESQRKGARCKPNRRRSGSVHRRGRARGLQSDRCHHPRMRTQRAMPTEADRPSHGGLRSAWECAIRWVHEAGGSSMDAWVCSMCAGALDGPIASEGVEEGPWPCGLSASKRLLIRLKIRLAPTPSDVVATCPRRVQTQQRYHYPMRHGTSGLAQVTVRRVIGCACWRIGDGSLHGVFVETQRAMHGRVWKSCRAPTR